MLHVTDYLWDPAKYAIPAVCVLFGNDDFLKFEAMRHIRDRVLDAEDAEFSLSRFDGASLSLARLLEELATTAMFGAGRRLVLVEDADKFVSNYRGDLEDYVESPSEASVLLLHLDAFPSNTNLYKKVAARGLAVDCSGLSEKQLPGWIVKWSKHRYNTSIEAPAAKLLSELAEPQMGLLDQELAKLSLMVEPGRPITAPLVESAVGSWRKQKAFAMFDAALAGNTGQALRMLSQLYAAEVSYVEIMNQIGRTLRKMGDATRLILDAEAARRKLSVESALTQVGMEGYYLKKTAGHLRALGRIRGAKLHEWLLRLELDFKGESPSPPQRVLETFLIRVSHPGLKTAKTD